MLLRRILLAAAALAVCIAQERADPAIAIDDLHGHIQHPFQTGAKAASVIFFIAHDCPIANAYSTEIRRICDEHSTRVACYLDYAEPGLSPQQAAKHFADYRHGDYPAFIDRKFAVVKAAGASVTPEAAVILPGGRIAYRGRIDNRYVTWGAYRPKPTEHDLQAALDAVLAGRPVAVARTKAIGCFIPPLDLLTK